MKWSFVSTLNIKEHFCINSCSLSKDCIWIHIVALISLLRPILLFCFLIYLRAMCFTWKMVMLWIRAICKILLLLRHCFFRVIFHSLINVASISLALKLFLKPLYYYIFFSFLFFHLYLPKHFFIYFKKLYQKIKANYPACQIIHLFHILVFLTV